jgi:hypothetical protein
MAFLIGVFGFNLLTEYIDDLPKRSDVNAKALGPDKDLQLETSSLTAGELHLFEAAVAGQTFSFVVQRTNDSIIHVAVATCRSCSRSGKPNYARKGDYYCGECKRAMRFEPHGEGDMHENCVMLGIPHSESNGILTVRARDVKAEFDSALAKNDPHP